MKNLNRALFTVFFLFNLHSVSAKEAAKTLKVPHSHMANDGGMVLMLGDDHVEILKTNNKLILHFSDKFREAVKVSDLEITVRIKGQADNLVIAPSPAMPTMAEIDLAAVKANTLELRAFRKVAPNPGYVLKKDFASFELAKVPQAKASARASH